MHEQYDQLIQALARSRRVLLTTHVRPDGDALGTVAAIALGLRQRGIDSTILLLSHLPTKYAFVLKDAGLDHIDAEAGIPASLEFGRFDALLVCDTGTWSQLPGLKERLAELPKQKLVLDHHLTQEDWPDLHVVDTTAAAAGEMAEMLLQRWGLAITAPIAQALFVAIASDTGWFQFSNTTPRTMRLVADLMEKGVDTDRLYQLLYQNERSSRLRVQQRAMQSLQLLAEDRLAIMTLTRDDLRDARANVNDTENLVNVPLMVRTVEVSVL
ncbi:MAG TPA: DHH family phosphoesterase, partial [Tepidisphaeraceae bacterium]|nr:DHH family phosphoesterase [Tepidisphaeraceae bacterium]